jgi:outer membrane protein assembly factor BamB
MKNQIFSHGSGHGRMDALFSISISAFFVLFIVTPTVAIAANWPAYMNNNSRNGVTAEQLNFSSPRHSLGQKWVFMPTHGPRPVWPSPPVQDLDSGYPRLSPKVIYDRAFHVVALDDSIYFGSSSDDKVYCLSADTGEVRWSFFAGGPVRLAPTLAAGKVYFGSDDGRVYCLRATDGSLVWTYKPSESSRMIIGNGRMISVQPCRTGVLVDKGLLYCGFGVFTKDGGETDEDEISFLCALDAETGKELWKTQESFNLQGYMLASSSRLYVAQGRSAPVICDRTNGKRLGQPLGWGGRQGGNYAFLFDDSIYVGPSSSGELDGFDAAGSKQDSMVVFDGMHAIVTPAISYIHGASDIRAIDRVRYKSLSQQKLATEKNEADLNRAIWRLDEKLADSKVAHEEIRKPIEEELEKQHEAKRKVLQERAQIGKSMDACLLWQHPCSLPYSFVMSGSALIAGGDGSVAAFSVKDGRELWRMPVRGKAYGLAVANGNLFVSTDSGAIHCFTSLGSYAMRYVQDKGGISRLPLNPQPFPKDELTDRYRAAADHIIEESGIRRGYCLVLESGQGRLAYELARRTELRVIALEADAQKVSESRKILDWAGYNGSRISVLHGTLATIELPKYFANLIVSDQMVVTGQMSENTTELYRQLHPFGGVACLGQPAIDGPATGASSLRQRLKGVPAGEIEMTQDDRGHWATIKRGPLPDSGQWTHLYGDASNRGSNQEKRVGAEMQIQWFGEPGGRNMIDRHYRTTAPLSSQGRLFIPGNQCIYGLDAYNGYQLWRKQIPGFYRVHMSTNCGNMVASDNRVYALTGNECRALDAQTGEHLQSFYVPDNSANEDWGYLACVDDTVYGSRMSTPLDGYRNKTTSDILFAMQAHTGDIKWSYTSNGRIVNPTIAIGDGQVFFVEAGDDHYDLVALDAVSGATAWREKHDFRQNSRALHLVYAEGSIAVTGASDKWQIQVFSARDGSALWNTSYEFARNGYGSDEYPPLVIGDVLFTEPYAHNLRNGTRVNLKGEEDDQWRLGGGRAGCSAASSSATCLIWGDRFPALYDITQDRGVRLNALTKAGCWVNFIPAGGMILIPEGSSGCSCSFHAIQTSLAYVHR